MATSDSICLHSDDGYEHSQIRQIVIEAPSNPRSVFRGSVKQELD